jgi:N-acetyl-anhydromuramyl-L-alanine amidase AmpD
MLSIPVEQLRHFTRTPTHILLHWSASPGGDAEEIDGWHRARDFACIGYHYVILNGHRHCGTVEYNPALDGKIETGRPMGYIGAQCAKHDMNGISLGVCLVGDPRRLAAGKYPTEKQLLAVVHACLVICKRYPGIEAKHIMQHSDFDRGKPLCASLEKHLPDIRKRVATAWMGLSFSS